MSPEETERLAAELLETDRRACDLTDLANAGTDATMHSTSGRIVRDAMRALEKRENALRFALDAVRSREARLVEALSLVAAPLAIDGLEHAAAVKHARAALEDGKR